MVFLRGFLDFSTVFGATLAFLGVLLVFSGIVPSKSGVHSLQEAVPGCCGLAQNILEVSGNFLGVPLPSVPVLRL